jgi:hypothetical protein
MFHLAVRRLTVATLVPGLFATSACTIRTADLTLATNRLVELDRVDLDTLPTQRRVKGQDSKFIPIIFPAVSLQPSLEAAIDDALNKGAGDLLTDAVVKIQTLFFVFGIVQTLTVEGDVVDTRQRGGEATQQ